MRPESDDLKASFELHRAEPGVSVDDHLRRKQIALAQSLDGRKIVYLDIWAWNRISDCILKGKSYPGVAALHRQLVDGVGCGRLVCPVSEAIFLELMKQSDARTRTATAELIDALSEGVCLMAPDTRMNTEVAYFIHQSMTEKPLHELDHLVWTKTAYVLGVAHPLNERLPPDEQRVLQKAFVDHLWDLRLGDMVQTLDPPRWTFVDMNGLAQRLNQSNQAHQFELTNFRKVYADEVAGAADLFAPLGCRVIADIFKKETGQEGRLQSAEKSDNEKMLRAILTHALTMDKARHILRSMHVHATCHAAIRWDRQRKLSANDLFDFQHATAALAYCDAFLCDRPMASLLTAKHTRLDQEMGCLVVSTPDALIHWFDELRRSPES